MAYRNHDEDLMQYQMITKMFYNMAVIAMFSYSIEHNLPISKVARRMNTAYHTLCKITGSWREDEQYKSDPRWRL